MARMKPRIYRAGPGDWRLVKPRFGFGSDFEELRFTSLNSAISSMTAKAMHWASGFSSDIVSDNIPMSVISGRDGDQWK